LDTVTVTGAEVVVVGLPLPWAMAVRVCEPLLAVVVSQEIEYGAVVVAGPRASPSSRNWTLATRTVSETVALTVIVPATGNPEVGDVMVTVGALDTVTVTGAEVAVIVLLLPLLPRPTAVKVCGPLLAVVVSHEIENGAVAAGGPRGAPSSRNWTFETRTLPVAVALTVIVPATGDPEAGDVMVTTRPSF